jgi:hypothetical protein
MNLASRRTPEALNTTLSNAAHVHGARARVVPARTVAFAFLAAAAAIATPLAHAANCDTSTDKGAWESAVDVNKRMGEEQQQILVIGRFTNEADKRQSPQGSTHTLLVTSTESGATGYILEADNPPDEPPTTMCIEDKISLVRLYDQGLSDTMSQAYIGGMPGLPVPPSQQTAAKTCESLVATGKVTKENCGFLDTDLARLGGEGQHPLVRANGVGKSGEPLTSVVITITGRPAGQGTKDVKQNVGAIFYSLLPSGATTYGNAFILPTFSEYAVHRLNESAALATEKASDRTPAKPGAAKK